MERQQVFLCPQLPNLHASMKYLITNILVLTGSSYLQALYAVFKMPHTI
mgnify:CR=1 FL=1